MLYRYTDSLSENISQNYKIFQHIFRGIIKIAKPFTEIFPEHKYWLRQSIVHQLYSTTMCFL